MAESKRVDAFGTFLRELREQRGAEQRGTERGADTQQQQVASAVDQAALLEILRALRGTETEPVPLLTVQATTGIPILRFAPMLQSIQEAGLVTIGGESGRETCALTPQGQALLRGIAG